LRVLRAAVPNIPEVPELDSEALTTIRKREAKRAAEAAEQTRRENEREAIRHSENMAKWRVGEYYGGFPYGFPIMLRFLGDEVQTSRGARFPVSHARRALAFVRKVRETGQAHVRNGHTIHLGISTLLLFRSLHLLTSPYGEAR
jgi:hypothetical protein